MITGTGLNSNAELLFRLDQELVRTRSYPVVYLNVLRSSLFFCAHGPTPVVVAHHYRYHGFVCFYRRESGRLHFCGRCSKPVNDERKSRGGHPGGWMLLVH